MAKVYLQRSRPGFRAVRGEIVRRVQLALNEAGSGPAEIDGIFGGDTEIALKDYQGRQGLTVDGKLTGETWSSLLSEDPPDIFQRSLQLTCDFEGHGFQKVAGNFDGAGVTWGIIGFTLRHGEVPKIIRECQGVHPNLIEQAFGDLKKELLEVVGRNWSQQLPWADGISLGSSKTRLKEPWGRAFETLGSFPEVQEIQLRRVTKYWEIATRDARRFKLKSERGVAMCFDIAVQNGGIDNNSEQSRIQAAFADNRSASEPERRLIIANVVAEGSRDEYVEDVRSRKTAIASGEGRVHGALYATADWGIEDDPWET